MENKKYKQGVYVIEQDNLIKKLSSYIYKDGYNKLQFNELKENANSLDVNTQFSGVMIVSELNSLYYRKSLETFENFFKNHTQQTVLILSGDIFELRQATTSYAGTIITCGFNAANDYVIRDIKNENTYILFSIYKNMTCIECDIKLPVVNMQTINKVALMFCFLNECEITTSYFRLQINKNKIFKNNIKLENNARTLRVRTMQYYPKTR